jgi:hypothetical protein
MTKVPCSGCGEPIWAFRTRRCSCGAPSEWILLDTGFYRHRDRTTLSPEEFRRLRDADVAEPEKPLPATLTQEPAKEVARSDDKPPANLVALIQEKKPRAEDQIRLARLMTDRRQVEDLEIGREVYEDEDVTEATIRKLLFRINRTLEQLGVRGRFRHGTGHVIWDPSPEDQDFGPKKPGKPRKKPRK